MCKRKVSEKFTHPLKKLLDTLAGRSFEICFGDKYPWKWKEKRRSSDRPFRALITKKYNHQTAPKSCTNKASKCFTILPTIPPSSPPPPPPPQNLAWSFFVIRKNRLISTTTSENFPLITNRVVSRFQNRIL